MSLVVLCKIGPKCAVSFNYSPLYISKSVHKTTTIMVFSLGFALTLMARPTALNILKMGRSWDIVGGWFMLLEAKVFGELLQNFKVASSLW